jgi:hypothetical protein
MKLNGIFSWFLVFLVAASLSAAAQGSAKILPEFKFYKLDGTAFTKSQINLQEKSIIIYFDPGCDHCQKEIESIGKRYNDFKNASFYLVSSYGKAEVDSFMRTYGKMLNGKKNVTVLLDPKMEFVVKFSPDFYPAIYVYSRGKLIKQFSGTKNVDDILSLM